MITVANAAGFLGDRLDAAKAIVESAHVDVLTLEYLAELTLSILTRAKQKDPALGYARDFLEVIRSIKPAVRNQSQLRIVTNAGGVNVPACAAAVAANLRDELADFPIATVTGDDILPSLEELKNAGQTFANLDTGQPLTELAQPVLSANVYMGAQPIVDSLDGGARLVLTGRVADASLTVGPAWHHFGWSADQWNELCGATIAGHLIECGAQVTGGYSTQWQQASGDIGYPIAEISRDGSAVVTKPPGSGGRVDRLSVTEQLVYEIGDPSRYLTPDVVADFTSVQLASVGANRVAVTGARGMPAPDTWKVSLSYHAGYRATAQLLVFGRDCLTKAQRCSELIQQRMQSANAKPHEFHTELLGAGGAVPGLVEPPIDIPEVMLRMTVCDPQREIVARFTKEIAPLITAGPAGLAGYASGRSQVQSVIAYWPTLIPKSFIDPQVEIRTAQDWSD